ncbi:MAG: hypothetical protein B1H02_06290 [Candidatus Latescibacteria bacterium 4484_107]|nr:MAG: hypothetical protein B1H02_06290 [Candidatus Latescibacteria bacterium 4484_107]
MDVVKRNIDWFINYWWNGRYFCGTINQDLTALIAIALYEKVECPSGYGTYLHAVVDYIESMVEKDGPTAGGDPQKRRARRGRCWPRAIRRARRFFSLSLSTSIGIARCGQRFESYIPTFDWRAYMRLILKEVPLRVTARGFGETSTEDWRSRASGGNVSTLEFLAEITEQEPNMEPFERVVLSRGPDVLTGRASYVLVESPEALFRIAETPFPALDLVLSKKAALPIVYPGIEGEPSFAVFSDDRAGEAWTYDSSHEEDGVYRYVAGDRERLFRIRGGVMEVVQTPYSGAQVRFEASPRNSSINRLVTQVNGTIVKERFSRLDGRNETVIESCEAWFTISNTSLRLRNGDMRVSFSGPIKRLVMDHRSANPQGKLRVSVELEACERLVITIQPGYFPIPGHKHIN